MTSEPRLFPSPLAGEGGRAQARSDEGPRASARILETLHLRSDPTNAPYGATPHPKANAKRSSASPLWGDTFPRKGGRGRLVRGPA